MPPGLSLSKVALGLGHLASGLPGRWSDVENVSPSVFFMGFQEAYAMKSEYLCPRGPLMQKYTLLYPPGSSCMGKGTDTAL